MGLSTPVPAPDRHAATGFLCRGGRLAAIMALIAGILGMHVITVNHSMHSPAAAVALPAGAANTSSAADAPAGHRAPDGHAHPVFVQDTTGQPSDPCPGNCHSIQATTACCTLSAKAGSLTAPLPGTTMFGAVPAADPPRSIPPRYSYLPGSPSPGELSISRT